MKTIFKYVIWAAVMVGLLLAALKYLNSEDFIRALRTFHWLYAPLILSLSTVYLSLKGWRFVLLLRPLCDLHWSVLLRAYVAGQPATLLPGGVAARVALLEQVDVPVAKSSAPVALSSILDQVLFLAGALVAALWFEPARLPALILLGILACAGLLLAVPLTRRWLSHALSWIIAKVNILERWQRFLQASEDIATPAILTWSLALTLATFAIRILILALSLWGMGISLPLSTLFLAYTLSTALARLVPVPGGFGVTEASMVGLLVSTSNLEINTAAAAVAIFRVATILFQAVLGLPVYFFFWQGQDEPATSS